MADVLLNKIINGEVDCDLFLSWLSCRAPNERNFEGFDCEGCSRTDFITFFLNYLHEEVPCNNVGKTPQKVNTPKRIVTKHNVEHTGNTFKRRQSLFTDEKVENLELNNSSVNKTNDSDPPCTPKVIQSLNNSITQETTYMSPISPLYKKTNTFETPKIKSQNSNDKATPLCLGDFITGRKSSGKKKLFRSLQLDDITENRTKRITPTNINNKKLNSKLRETTNSFDFRNLYGEEESSSTNAQRGFLAEERNKILSRGLTSTPKKINTNLSFKCNNEPEDYLVTHSDQLEIIVKIYIYLLKKNWILNITSEVYFVISLLLTKLHKVDFKSELVLENSSEGESYLNGSAFEYESKTGKRLYNSEIFESVHNVVFFACKCLENLIDVLKCYDKSTLRLLGDNQRLKKFNPSLAKIILDISESKIERSIEISPSDLQTNVCFNIDTDHKENFPTSASFHSFRKQRDLFYEILRIWENNHLLAGWSFQVSLVGKIKSLMCMSTDPVNFVHFARLFKAQLLSTCGKLPTEEGLSESQVAFLPSLPNLDVEKLNRLKSRLVTKQASNGINALPIFPGHQEFYKEFIVHANHHIFNRHLCDSLVDEIADLNNNKFEGFLLDGSGDNDVDTSTRQSYVTCIKSLRVLAKFLGFLESMPYKSENFNYAENILRLQIKVRQDVCPGFDVRTILIRSIQEKQVIIVIPWIIKYLAMLDYVSLRLPYYLEVHKILFHLYQNFNSNVFFNNCLVKICLGWLFELPHFPESEFFKYSLEAIDTPFISPVKTQQMDNLEVIDQNVLYICCPFLGELKKILTSTTFNTSGVTVKHITPVTALQSTEEIAKKKLEQQLEEAFFNGQPISVRKTVEFVSERVASSCVKHICNTLVPNFKKNAVREIKVMCEEWRKNNLEVEKRTDHHKSTLRLKANQLAQTYLQRLKKECEQEVAQILKVKIPPTIEGLCALDSLKATHTTCTTITQRICRERVVQWINSHVNIGIFTKDFDSELMRIFADLPSPQKVTDKPVFLLPAGGSAKIHNERAMSAAHLLEKIRDLSLDIIENTIEITDDFILKLLKDINITLIERNDVNESITAFICSQLVDLSLLLVTHHCRVMRNREILSNLVTIWRLYYGNTDTLFQYIVSPRNIMLLAQSSNVKKSWETLAIFMAYMVKEKIVTCNNFESQCTAIFRCNWDEDSLKNLTNFLADFVTFYKSYGKNDDKFTLLLDFLAEFCVDL